MAPDEKPDIYKIVRMCMERNYDPLIVFSFSKKECENLAKQVRLLPPPSWPPAILLSLHLCDSMYVVITMTHTLDALRQIQAFWLCAPSL